MDTKDPIERPNQEQPILIIFYLNLQKRNFNYVIWYIITLQADKHIVSIVCMIDSLLDSQRNKWLLKNG